MMTRLSLVAGVLTLTLLARHGYACGPVQNQVMTAGTLAGFRAVTQTVPRNVAFLWAGQEGAAVPVDPVGVGIDSVERTAIRARVGRRITKQSVFTTQLSALFIAKADEPLAPGLSFFAPIGESRSYTTGDYIDDQPSAAPGIVSGEIQHYDGPSGCSEADSCTGPSTTLIITFDAPPMDDHTPSELLTYAIYLEKSADEARTAPTPFGLFARPLLTDGNHMLITSIEPSWLDSDAFVTLSVLDLAGNESARSEPWQVGREGSGCAIKTRSRHRPVVASTLALLAVLGWARRRTRRR